MAYRSSGENPSAGFDHPAGRALRPGPEKAARIANAAAARGRSSVGKKGGKSGSYEDWTVDDLRKRVKELGLSGYSGKNKSELVSMLRESLTS